MHDCIFKFESQGSSGFYHSVILSNILVDILNDVMVIYRILLPFLRWIVSTGHGKPGITWRYMGDYL